MPIILPLSPTQPTAGELINGALRLIGMLAEGETTSSEASADSLVAMQQMIDSWSTERLSIFTTQEQVFTWPAGSLSRTLGPSGDFIGNRPIQLDDSTYFIDPARERQHPARRCHCPAWQPSRVQCSQFH